MINVYDLSNATPVAIFGMFALWAAVSRSHWFLRTAIVGGAILTTLLIPAYEVVILLTVQTATVVAGIAVWRRRRSSGETNEHAIATRPRLRLSMETLLLAMAVIAVVTTVAARAPSIPLGEWYQTLLSGVSSGVTTFVCVWLVFGSALWWLRLLAALLFIPGFAFTFVGLQWAGHRVVYWYRSGGTLSSYTENAWSHISANTLAWSKPVGLSMAILCLFMYLMHRAGWFDPSGEHASSVAASAKLRLARARTWVVAFCCAAAIFPLALFYRLLTPTPLPDVKLPQPNGFDDFIAAGHMIGPVSGTTLLNYGPLSDAALRAEVTKHDDAIERMRSGLEKACWNTRVNSQSVQNDDWALIHLMSAVSARCELADRSGSVDDRVAAYWDLLRFSFESDRGYGTNYSVGAQSEPYTILGLWKCRTRLSSEQCINLAAKLWKLETTREPWHIRAERQRAIDENINWQWRLMCILAEWHGEDRYAWRRAQVMTRMVEMRMLIVELGLRAHRLELGSAPATLAELLPRYLSAVPDDPFAEGAMIYRATRDHYVLYSVGPDGDDDRGQPGTAGSQNANGDLTAAVLFPSAAGDAGMPDADYMEFSNKPAASK
jgi:hypothetical protein